MKQDILMMNWCSPKGMKLLSSGLSKVHLPKISKRKGYFDTLERQTVISDNIPRIVLRFALYCYTSAKMCYIE